MNYLIGANEVVKISETSGTIQNADQINKVELSDTENFTNNIILYPLQKLTFQNQLYARLFDNADLPVELRVIPIQLDSGGGSSGGGSGDYAIATDAEFKDMLDEVLPTVTSGEDTDPADDEGEGGQDGDGGQDG